jgi:hypothetical protein
MRISPLARALERLHYTYEVAKYFYQGRIFLPQNITIWLKAPSESLGGTLKDTISITELYATIQALRERFAREFYSEEFFSSVVMVNGKWNLNGEKLEGFISANNDDTWRSVYYDIEIDVYARGHIKDIADVIWGKPNLENFFPNFVKELRRVGRGHLAKPREIYFSIGAPEYGEVDNLLALRLQDRRRMIDFLYSKIRKSKESWVKNKIAPIDRSFFVSSINEQRAVQRMFSQFAQESLLVEITGRSVVYVAKERDSFAKFYKRFKEKVFEPASRELPDAKEIKRNMLRGLEKIETLG